MGQEMSLVDKKFSREALKKRETIRLTPGLEEALEAKLRQICRPNIDKTSDPSAPRFLGSAALRARLGAQDTDIDETAWRRLKQNHSRTTGYDFMQRRLRGSSARRSITIKSLSFKVHRYHHILSQTPSMQPYAARTNKTKQCQTHTTLACRGAPAASTQPVYSFPQSLRLGKPRPEWHRPAYVLVNFSLSSNPHCYPSRIISPKVTLCAFPRGITHLIEIENQIQFTYISEEAV